TETQQAENDARASRVVSEQSELTVQAPANAINGIATNSLRPSAALEHCYWPFHPYIFITSVSAVVFSRSLHEKNEALLKSCQGYWPIKVRKHGDGLLYFEGGGWKEFVEHHGLELGEFLVLKHQGIKLLLMLKTTTFKGANVFMSRNLVPPEIFDALHDALKLNGANVFLCCDPSRTGPDDYHVIASSDHEKFEDLRAKGCNLLGPQCVFSCANQHRALPKQGFTCCLAMDGFKVLASGFEGDEKAKIEKLWALNTLKKPIVTMNWLSQCWNEHRNVPQDSFRMNERRLKSLSQKMVEKGDKYKVAQRWGHIRINSQRSSSGNLQSVPPSVVADSNLTAAPCSGTMDSDLEATVSQNMTTMFSHAPHVVKNEDSKAPPLESKSEAYLDGCVADDSQSEDNDLYLSECRISLVGFKVSEMRSQKKEVRGFAALGVIHVVRTTWLDDCDREKKEIPVLPKHIAYDLVLPEGALIGMTSMIQGTISTTHLSIPSDQLHGNTSAATGMGSLEKKREKKPEINMKGDKSMEAAVGPSKWSKLPVINGKSKVQLNNTIDGRLTMQYDSSVQNGKESSVFKGDYFAFQIPFLKIGHILYAPLPCRIPLPGFENFRFCVSQYEEKDRLLLRNLCFVLGAKFGEKLTKKVTHLLCKFTNGPKYQAACIKGIHPITAEWVYECVKKNKVVALDQFYPKKVTAEDREAGLCTMSQYPTQAVQMISAGNSSECPSQSQDLRTSSGENIGSRNDSLREEASEPSFCNKKARVSEDDGEKGLLSSGKSKSSGEVSQVVPDVASAIEDLLEQTSKIHDQKSPGRSLCDSSLHSLMAEQIFSPECSALRQDHSDSHSIIGLSRHWLNRAGKKDDIHYPSEEQKAGLYDGFSETQTESQVVGYEEDLSGRQMLIDRVRTRSSLA
ncbi:transcription coactivator, partial [Prunus dulcis]